MRPNLPRRQDESRGLRLWPVGTALALTFSTAITVAAAVFLTGWGLLDVQNLKPERQLTSKTLFDLVKLSFGVVAGAGALVALVVAYRRQRIDEDGALRDATRLHTERFTTAVSQLGEESAAVRLGGVHALAGLADDAPTRDLRQTCIDVLCAYLRLPYTSQTDFPSEDAGARHTYLALREVRHTVIRLIRDHLSLPPEHPRSWEGHDLDFTGVVFDGGDFSGASFRSGMVDFSNATFSGSMVDFNNTTFSGSTVNFNHTKFLDGTVNFNHATFSNGTVNFNGAEFNGSTVRFDYANFNGGTVNFEHAEINNGGIDFNHATISRDSITFSHAAINGGVLRFNDAGFNGGAIHFEGASINGGKLAFRDASFDGSIVNFDRASFNGGTIEFDDTTISGGVVIFTYAAFSGSTTNFNQVTFFDGFVDFGYAVFSSGEISFTDAGFNGETVSFDNAAFNGGTVDFNGAFGSSPSGIFSPSGQPSPFCLNLPRSWQPSTH
ncbi:hypothetical protein CUT44_03955 [Streptomyces carminius]|uniref:Pentapeptide repeat-containing protein n=1 Tax=Streptomyces carminius TaxID=2665496 RepID=A0A2M8M629_9ACTN|nr:hypothetical protein CUT44_03955 [Streptomyces carminius]